MKEFIFENELSLDSAYCDYLINVFESNKEVQSEGELGSSENDKEDSILILKDVKKTIDISIPNDIPHESVFYDIHKHLKNELFKNVNEYYKNIDPTNEIYHTNLIHKKLSFNGFLMTKYIKNEGFFKIHNDFCIKNNRYRLFNFIWYLNEIEEGGRTIFFDDSSIKPKKGKLVIFPSEWFFSHKAEIPLTDHKFIITGWIYNEK